MKMLKTTNVKKCHGEPDSAPNHFPTEISVLLSPYPGRPQSCFVSFRLHPTQLLLEHLHQALAQTMALPNSEIDWEKLKPRILLSLANGCSQQEVRKRLAEDQDDTVRVSIR